MKHTKMLEYIRCSIKTNPIMKNIISTNCKYSYILTSRNATELFDIIKNEKLNDDHDETLMYILNNFKYNLEFKHKIKELYLCKCIPTFIKY